MKKKVRRFESGIRTKGIEAYKSDWFPTVNLKSRDIEYHGEQYLFKFHNGYGASIIRHMGAYCDLNVFMKIDKLKEYKPKEQRTYEIGILDSNGYLMMPPFDEYFEGDEVAGNLNYKQINEVLEKIENL